MKTGQQTDPARRSRWPRRLRRVLIGLLGLYALFLASGNLFLRTGLGPALLGRQPEQFQAAWVSAWTVWPGRGHVRQLDLRGQTQRTRWDLRLEGASFDYGILALAARRFTARRINGSGLHFRLRRRPEPGAEAAIAGGAPEIPGFSTPLTGPSGPPPPPRRWPWRVSLSVAEVDDVREVWIEEQRLVGSGRLSGDWTFTPRGSMEMGGSTLEFAGGQILVGEETTAEEVQLVAEVHLDPFVPRENPGRDALRFLSGRLRFRSPRSAFGFLDRYFRSAPWLAVDGGGRVVADVRITDGVLAPGGRIEIAAEELALRALEFRAAGRGEIRGEVAGAGDGETRLEVRLTAFELHHVQGPDGVGRGEEGEADRAVLVRGDDFRLQAACGAFDLAAEAPELEMNLAVATCEIPELSAYNRFLPEGSMLAIRSGKGSFAGQLALSTAEDSGRGSLDIRAEAAALVFGEAEGSGDLRFTLRLRGAELERRRFDVSGTRLEIDGFRPARAGGSRQDIPWWARLELRRAQLLALPPASLSADFEAEMRDSWPVVTFLAERQPLVGWIAGLLTVEQVSAEGLLGVDSQAWSVDGLRISGEGLEILGDDLRLSRERCEGLLYFSRGPLSASVELEGGERNWKLVQARQWFEQRAGRRGGAKAPGGDR